MKTTSNLAIKDDISKVDILLVDNLPNSTWLNFAVSSFFPASPWVKVRIKLSKVGSDNENFTNFLPCLVLSIIGKGIYIFPCVSSKETKYWFILKKSFLFELSNFI